MMVRRASRIMGRMKSPSPVRAYIFLLPFRNAVAQDTRYQRSGVLSTILLSETNAL